MAVEAPVVKVYQKSRDYEHDAKKMAKKGYRIVSTVDHRLRPSVGRRLMFGIFAGGKNEIVVTYQKD